MRVGRDGGGWVVIVLQARAGCERESESEKEEERQKDGILEFRFRVIGP
jgi:hypothetical protein